MMIDEKIKEYEKTEGYEFCRHCGWKNINDKELPQEGAPISGVYQVCPKCGKHWCFDKDITKRIKMVSMSKKHFDKLLKIKQKEGIQIERKKIKKEIIKKAYNIGTEFRHINVINIKDINIWNDKE